MRKRIDKDVLPASNMLRRLAVIAILLAVDALSKEEWTKVVQRGEGCWWEGDDWQHAVSCCGCKTCDERGPASRRRPVDAARELRRVRPRARCPRDRRDSRRSWLDRCCAWGTHINDANPWSQRCCPCDLDSDVGREDGPG